MKEAMAALIDEYLDKEKALVKKQWEKEGVHLDGESEELKALRKEYYEKIKALGEKNG